mgnify:CR=1 FL=1
MINNRNIYKLYICIAFYLSTITLDAQSLFVQNKGQLPHHVIAKVKLPSGSLFVEEGKLTFAFFSGSQLAELHDLKSNIREINAHAYEMNFIKSNNSIKVELQDESKYFENYIFTDFLSSEIFAYDFLNNKLKTIPLGNLGHRFHTLDIHPTKKDTVLLTTRSGYLFEVKLP